MSSKRQLTTPRDAGNNQPLGEGFETLITSARNKLVFRSPAERYAYQMSPANSAQMGRNRGSHNQVADNRPQ